MRARRRARARPRRPRPSVRPTMICAAMATASSTSARKTKSWKAIWWAASDGAPTRASTAEATRKEPSSAAVRTAISVPIRIRLRMRAGTGRSQPARSCTARKAPPMPSWAITVPHAEPASPQPKPYTNSTSSTTLTACAATRISSGVRRSPIPRR